MFRRIIIYRICMASPKAGKPTVPEFTKISIINFLMITPFAEIMPVVIRCSSYMAEIMDSLVTSVSGTGGYGFPTNAVRSNGVNIMGNDKASMRSNKGKAGAYSKGGGGGGGKNKSTGSAVTPELISQRYELYNELSYQLNTGGDRAFPGSKKYNETQNARRALTEFDKLHPEVKKQPKSGGSANEY